jgi:hypothetical protein
MTMGVAVRENMERINIRREKDNDTRFPHHFDDLSINSLGDCPH